MRKTPMRSLSWRRIIVILLLLAQILVTVFILYNRSQTSQIISSLLLVVSVMVAVYIGGRQDIAAYKTLWIMMILVFPLFGGIFYLLFNYQVFSGRFRKPLREIAALYRSFFLRQESRLPVAEQKRPDCAALMTYLENYAGFPVYGRTDVEFFDSGESFFESLLVELDKAERYIFIESFIMSEGRMLNTVLDKLEAKVKQGVEVRIMYDDIGCFMTLPKNYDQYLSKRGFKCTVFNPFRPVLSSLQNNRDHRKIISIDGKTAFTGGTNLADEYINERERFGHWRDACVMLRGEAAWSLTLFFLELWNFSNKVKDDVSVLYPWTNIPCTEETKGYVQPYADNPVTKENVGEQVYLHVITSAKNYLYINTPYLIIDGALMSALKLAAKSGVDVRIMTPHIWDKRLVHYTTRSYYREFTAAGIRIYEYTPGFNHSKTFVADDHVATVGTVNLDFRSLYLHFECGTVLYDCDAVMAVKEDFLRTLSSCQEIGYDDCEANFFVRIGREFLRIFAPLM